MMRLCWYLNNFVNIKSMITRIWIKVLGDCSSIHKKCIKCTHTHTYTHKHVCTSSSMKSCLITCKLRYSGILNKMCDFMSIFISFKQDNGFFLHVRISHALCEVVFNIVLKQKLDVQHENTQWSLSNQRETPVWTNSGMKWEIYLRKPQSTKCYLSKGPLRKIDCIQYIKMANMMAVMEIRF